MPASRMRTPRIAAINPPEPERRAGEAGVFSLWTPLCPPASRGPSGHRRHRSRPILRLGLQHRLDQRPHRRGNAGKVRHDAPLVDHLGLAAAHVERPAAQRLGENEAETVDVGFRPTTPPASPSCSGETYLYFPAKPSPMIVPSPGPHRPGDAEVDEFRLTDVAIGQDHVVGRHVAVNDAELMRGFERAGDAGAAGCARPSIDSGPSASFFASETPSTNSMAR